ncbi:uncharacterized protein LOC141690739 [Apium graveolens]|uniref:uncharacterized protein LOC141690739 n=1 Tax=Apium graveolens TaxID=4045 RepID=UPI003D78DAEC
MTITSKFSFADMQNPLFLHPSDGPLSISVTKLQGSSDYRTWRRSMEIQLASKRKLGFVEGTEIKSTTDTIDALQCNGSRKYKVSKDLYSLKQNGKPLVEYHTTLSALWEELEVMNDLPKVTTTTAEMTALLKVIQVQNDESKLFQFLNGLDEVFRPQMSQLLMSSPLPSVEMACAAIQQEDSQRDILHNLKNSDDDISTMFSRGNQIIPEKSVMKEKAIQQMSVGLSQDTLSAGGKGETSNIVITHQQFEQLLKLIPGNAAGQTEEEFDTPFSGMITFGAAKSKIQEWIVDSGVSDHMTCSLNLLHNIRPALPHMAIKLPTGSTANITHIGDTVLSCGNPLFNVLFVPQFTHNLLSVTKLGKDNKCEVMFKDAKCFVTKSDSKVIVGVGIKTIRSDNAPEFSDQLCTKFMNDHGIVYQTTCSYRPQQNARVERKHRHVLNVARALKLQSGLADVHWDDCVLATTYVINRVPSSVLKDNVSPYEMLFGEPPDYKKMKVFECLAMDSPPGVSTDKFKPRVVACVFVGYRAAKKGFKLLTLDYMTSFVSRDVQFHEHISPLLDSSALIQPVPVILLK